MLERVTGDQTALEPPCTNGQLHLDGLKCAPCGHHHCQRCGICIRCVRADAPCENFRRELPRLVPWQSRNRTLRRQAQETE